MFILGSSNKKKTHKKKRRKFTPEEDTRLRALVEQFGTKSWEKIAKFMPNRCGRQCRDRYSNYLDSRLFKRDWTPEEDELIVSYYRALGPHWVDIAKHLDGRSGNNVKNRWHKYISKTLFNKPEKNEKKHRIKGASRHRIDTSTVAKRQVVEPQKRSESLETLFDDIFNEDAPFEIDQFLLF